MPEQLQLPVDEKEKVRVLVDLSRGKSAEYKINGQVFVLVPRRPPSTSAQVDAKKSAT